MSLYAIGDLHLSFGTNKPMDIFFGWEGYVERLEENWHKAVSPEDTVVIVGDISWAMKMQEAKADFDFINKLPGKKIILKGNHDYWWDTKAKMDRFLAENSFTSISILHNNAFACDKYAICGTRGWISDNSEPADQKVLLREAGRLDTSLKAGLKLGLEPIVFLHYPPIYGNDENLEILEVLHRYKVNRCYYGHIHGLGHKRAINGVRDGIDYRLVACDFIDYTPINIS